VNSEAWDRDVAELVLSALPLAPARILEVGCGEGRLARSLSVAGYGVVAIDPDAPERSLFKRATIEEFVASEPFKAAIATLRCITSPTSMPRSRRSTTLSSPEAPSSSSSSHGDRFDDATAAWALKRLLPGSEDGWLARRRNEWNVQGGGDINSGFAEYLRRWATSNGFHSSAVMLEACRRHFGELQFEAWPYLYPELEGVTREQEIAEIEAGRIQSTGFSFVGSAHSAPYDAAPNDS
jgi:SAM-dependent methyltransferase